MPYNREPPDDDPDPFFEWGVAAFESYVRSNDSGLIGTTNESPCDCYACRQDRDPERCALREEARRLEREYEEGRLRRYRERQARAQRLISCYGCGLETQYQWSYVPDDGHSDRRYCMDCWNSLTGPLYRCDECGSRSESPLHSSEYDLCSGCVERHSNYRPRTINNYSYRPIPNFHGEGRVYLGMELELEIDTDYNTDNDGYFYSSDSEYVIKVAERAMEYLGDLGYLKEDGSISTGFELVTHPMTHDYAVQSFPWDMLIVLESMGAYSGSDIGIHIHVNRSGFDGPAHVFRWLKFLYRNAPAVSAIARRRSDNWARFDTSARQRAKDFAKGERNAGRYSAVNVQNRHTFEVRVFASSLREQEVRAAMDLVAGSVEYTRYLTVREINNGGWTWQNFIKWAKEKGDTYAALVAESEIRV